MRHRNWNHIRSEKYENKCRKNKPSTFAGGWKMDENEVEKIKSELKESWKRWEL